MPPTCGRAALFLYHRHLVFPSGHAREQPRDTRTQHSCYRRTDHAGCEEQGGSTRLKEEVATRLQTAVAPSWTPPQAQGQAPPQPSQAARCSTFKVDDAHSCSVHSHASSHPYTHCRPLPLRFTQMCPVLLRLRNTDPPAWPAAGDAHTVPGPLVRLQ